MRHKRNVTRLSLLMYSLVLLSLLFIFTLASCSGSGNATADSAAADSLAAVEAEADTLPRFYLTSRGLGPVSVGEPLDSILPGFKGLYTAVNREPGYECESLVFCNGEAPEADTYPFTVLDFGGGKVDVILLNDTQCAVQTPEGDITLDTPFVRVLSLPGVKAEWQSLDNAGAWFWTWQGIWFQPAVDSPDEALGHKLYDSGSAPTAADMSGSIRTGYIGTGVPY